MGHTCDHFSSQKEREREREYAATTSYYSDYIRLGEREREREYAATTTYYSDYIRLGERERERECMCVTLHKEFVCATVWETLSTDVYT